MAELYSPPGVRRSLPGPLLSHGWLAEPISCSSLPLDLWGMTLEFVLRGLEPALAGEDLGSGGPVAANKGSEVHRAALPSWWPHCKLG